MISVVTFIIIIELSFKQIETAANTNSPTGSKELDPWTSSNITTTTTICGINNQLGITFKRITLAKTNELITTSIGLIFTRFPSPIPFSTFITTNLIFIKTTKYKTTNSNRVIKSTTPIVRNKLEALRWVSQKSTTIYVRSNSMTTTTTTTTTTATTTTTTTTITSTTTKTTTKTTTNTTTTTTTTTSTTTTTTTTTTTPTKTTTTTTSSRFVSKIPKEPISTSSLASTSTKKATTPILSKTTENYTIITRSLKTGFTSRTDFAQMTLKTSNSIGLTKLTRTIALNDSMSTKFNPIYSILIQLAFAVFIL